MCGIVCVAGKITARENRIFKTLLILDSLRGLDSTGIAAIHRKSKWPQVYKKLGNPFELVESRQYERIINSDNRVLIGHNRYATQGGITVANAHPFEFENVVGVHNGTLKNKHILDQGHKFPVDSEALYNHIDKHGIKDAVKGLDGAWALVWWNMASSTLNMLRNKERPLFCTYEEGGQTMFMASEKWMLDVALSREGVKYPEPDQIPTDMHIKITFKESGEVESYEEEEVKSSFQPPFTPTLVPTGGNLKTSTTPSGTDKNVYLGAKNRLLTCHEMRSDKHGNRYYICKDHERTDLIAEIRLYVNRNASDLAWLGKSFTGNISERPQWENARAESMYYKVIHSSASLVKDEEDDKPTLLKIPGGKLVDLDSWKALFGNSCACCSVDIDPNYPETFKYTTTGDVVCINCVEDPETLQYLPQLVNA